VIFDRGTGGDFDVCTKPANISGTYMADHSPEHEDIGSFDVKGRLAVPVVPAGSMVPVSPNAGSLPLCALDTSTSELPIKTNHIVKDAT